jgi:type IV fimbrial biogenesis protein FimT
MRHIRSAARQAQRAFTLIEMMIVIAIMAIIIVLVAPNMTEMIGMQRLRSINDQLATDFQYMRSESVSRNQYMGIVTRNVSTEPVSCYVIFSNAASPLDVTAIDRNQCNCANAIGSACTGTHRELRTVQIPRELSIELRFPTDQPNFMAINPVNGSLRFNEPSTLVAPPLEFCIEVRRSPRGRLRTSVGASGRTSVCSPDGSVPGVQTCPAYNAGLNNCKATS